MYYLALEYTDKLSAILRKLTPQLENTDLAAEAKRLYSSAIPRKDYMYDYRSLKLIWALENIARGSIAFALWRCDRPSHEYFREHGALTMVPRDLEGFRDYLTEIAQRLEKVNL